MKDKKDYITILQVVSAISVVFLHTNSFMECSHYSKLFFLVSFFECLFYFPVPIFFMLAGVNLINYKENYSTFVYIKKRVLKVLVPFIFWSLVSLLFCLYIYKSVSFESLNIKFVASGIFNCSFIPIFKFFIPLLILYLLIPFINIIKNNSKIYTTLIILSFLVSQISNDYMLIFYSCAVTYALIGYMISNMVPLDKKTRFLVYFMAISGFLIHYSSNFYGYYDKFYAAPSCFLYSIGVFVFFKHNVERLYRSNMVKKLIEFLREYYYAIFLLHYNIMKSLTQYFNLSSGMMFSKYVMPFFIIILSVILTKIIRKLPLGRILLPK